MVGEISPFTHASTNVFFVAFMESIQLVDACVICCHPYDVTREFKPAADRFHTNGRCTVQGKKLAKLWGVEGHFELHIQQEVLHIHIKSYQWFRKYIIQLFISILRDEG